MNPTAGNNTNNNKDKNTKRKLSENVNQESFHVNSGEQQHQERVTQQRNQPLCNSLTRPLPLPITTTASTTPMPSSDSLLINNHHHPFEAVDIQFLHPNYMHHHLKRNDEKVDDNATSSAAVASAISSSYRQENNNRIDENIRKQILHQLFSDLERHMLLQSGGSFMGSSLSHLQQGHQHQQQLSMPLLLSMLSSNASVAMGSDDTDIFRNIQREDSIWNATIASIQLEQQQRRLEQQQQQYNERDLNEEKRLLLQQLASQQDQQQEQQLQKHQQEHHQLQQQYQYNESIFIEERRKIHHLASQQEQKQQQQQQQQHQQYNERILNEERKQHLQQQLTSQQDTLRILQQHQYQPQGGMLTTNIRDVQMMNQSLEKQTLCQQKQNQKRQKRNDYIDKDKEDEIQDKKRSKVAWTEKLEIAAIDKEKIISIVDLSPRSNSSNTINVAKAIPATISFKIIEPIQDFNNQSLLPSSNTSSTTTDVIEHNTTTITTTGKNHYFGYHPGTLRPLHLDTDTENISEYQCLLRKQICLFAASTYDLQCSAQGRNKPIVVGQVGIVCKYCCTIPPGLRASGSVYYPATVNGLYQAAQNMGSNHFMKRCPQIPNTIRQEMLDKKDKKTIFLGGGKRYWVTSSQRLGLVEGSNDELRFQNNNNQQQN